MRSTVIFALLFAACATKGSGSTNNNDTQDSSEFASAAPSVSALTLDATASDTTSASRAESLPPSVAGDVKIAVTEVNDALKAVLGNVEAMIAQAPTGATGTSGDARVWVESKNGITYQLTVSKEDGYNWRMDAKKDADTTFTLVMGGHIKGTKHGFIGIDLTAYHTVSAGTAAAITQEGKLFGAFAHNQFGAHLVYRLKDYKKDASSSVAAQSAYFSGYRLFKKGSLPAMSFIRAGGTFNVTQFADLAGPENEIVTARLRRLVGIGGWGRAVIHGGNLPDGTQRRVRECWSSPASSDELLYARETWDCTATACTRIGSYSFPEGTALDVDAKAPLLNHCFPDATAAVKARLANLAANETSPPADPAQSDAADEQVVAADDDQASVDNVDNDDALAVDSTTMVTAK